MITVFLKNNSTAYSDTVDVHHISEIINGPTSLVPIHAPHFLLYVTEDRAKYYVSTLGNFTYMFNDTKYIVTDNKSFLKFYSALESALIDDVLK
jgi:hypothetical protein